MTMRLIVVVRSVVAVAAVTSCLACSNAALYDIVQSHQQEQCLKPPVAAVESCLEAARVPYSEYERLRDDVGSAEPVVLPGDAQGQAESVLVTGAKPGTDEDEPNKRKRQEG